MKAAILNRYGDNLVLDDVDVDLPAPDEVLIRVVASGVCHSDRTLQLGAQGRPLPIVLGHEIAGVVTRVGETVSHVAPGDHVVTCVSAACGCCEWCAAGHQQHCTDKGADRAGARPPRLSQRGSPVHALGGLGGFAEEALVSEKAVVKISRDMPLDKAALLGCAVITGVGAVRNASTIIIGDTVAVVGCGGVGLNVIQGARLAGASRIFAIDRLGIKESLARAMGATDFIDASRVDPVETVRDATRGGVHHAFEVVGAAATIEQVFSLLRPMGTAYVLGVARPEVRASLAATDFLVEKRVQGVRMGSAAPRIDIPLYAEMYLAGQLKLDELLTHRLKLLDVNYALQELDNPVGARSVVIFD